LVISRNLLHLRGARALAFAVGYNSLHVAQSGALGYGWYHNFEIFLFPSADLTSAIIGWNPTRQNVFVRVDAPDGAVYLSPDEAARDAILTRKADGTWTLAAATRDVWTFASDGKLSDRAHLWQIRLAVL
jgi:hypothetical protein